ncbi:hypothetical protein ASD83_15625 [Devosia sp. Root685]|uniref:DNA cytosine methyltransferase n=1 Tax=Devosia sp. Root685 TaxID=1736587 RepID=UPI0006FCE5E0|nr:DNA cytosine methyltransferase [Devosia sp. Root685]KRA96534.1 hypothetical protein ASD83_15625 [Devosia sp. Root685]
MQLRSIDLFAGCGGLSLGLGRAGFQTVVASELDQWAAATYSANFPDVDLKQGDVAEIDPSFWKGHRGQIDLVAGGPPCQGYSVAGRRQFGEIPGTNSLVDAFIDVVELVRPRAVLLENVAGFRTAHIRPGVKALPHTIARLEDLGYYVQYKILQAADFGVPSLRSRLFLIATASALQMDPFEHIAGLAHARVSTLEAIGDLPQIAAGEGKDDQVDYDRLPTTDYQVSMRVGSSAVTNHVAMKHTPRLIERFRGIAPGGSSYRLSAEKVTVYKSNNQRLIGEEPSLCITANFQSSYIHPIMDRNLTAREAARLMSFPDSFKFKGKRTLMSRNFLKKYGREHEAGLSQYNQIGNSVPPKLAECLGRAINEALKHPSSASDCAA